MARPFRHPSDAKPSGLPKMPKPPPLVITRGSLPPSDPATWQAITTGTVLEGRPFG